MSTDVDLSEMFQRIHSMEARREQDNSGVFGDERNCSNCAHYEACGWVNANNDGLPNNFTYRADWNEERFTRHMKAVIGQVCGNFSSRNPARFRTPLRLRETARRSENGWDEEENR